VGGRFGNGVADAAGEVGDTAGVGDGRRGQGRVGWRGGVDFADEGCAYSVTVKGGGNTGNEAVEVGRGGVGGLRCRWERAGGWGCGAWRHYSR